ncbi:MAG TPA: globin [Caulobacteraceae bacterium]
MTERAQIINRSLELIGERCADPTPLVYDRLFAANPQMRELFLRDENDSVKGHMLFEVIEAILDFEGKGAYARNLILCEIVNHENLGVPKDVFATFFAVVMETFRDLLGADWTAEVDGAWRGVIADLNGLTAAYA